MAEILMLYSTVDGHTRKICTRLCEVIEARGHQVTLANIEEAQGVDLNAYDKIVIGASIRYGKHRPNVYDFIRRHHAVLDSRPNAFFTVNVVARKPEKSAPDTNPYMVKFLRQIPWAPRQLAVFAGKIDYRMYRFLDRVMIRFIMWLTKGPTDPQTNIEFTDWEQVEAFGRTISDL